MVTGLAAAADKRLLASINSMNPAWSFRVPVPEPMPITCQWAVPVYPVAPVSPTELFVHAEHAIGLLGLKHDAARIVGRVGDVRHLVAPIIRVGISRAGSDYQKRRCGQ